MSQTISTDYSAIALDRPERVAAIIEAAKERSLREKCLIWVTSFDPGAQWGTGRCWMTTSTEPLPSDRIEGTARAGVYTAAGA